MSEYFQFLDDIQTKVYENLRVLVKYEAGEDQSKILLVINKLLIKYKEYLKILDCKVKEQSDEAILLEIYESKLAALKTKIRSVQLKIDEMKNERIHQERIQKYHLNDENYELDNESAREWLFAGRSSKKHQNRSVNDEILLHNKKITSTLQTTKQLMSTSILQTELNVDALDQQTKDLKNLNEEYMKFNSLLSRSKEIVKFIEKQDKNDKRRIYMALGFFGLCCAWVIWRRILRTPIRLFLWSLLKVFRIVGWIFNSSNLISTSIDNVSYDTFSTSDIASTLPTKIATTVSEMVEEGIKQSSLSEQFTMISAAPDILMELESLTSIASSVSQIILQASEIFSEVEDISSMTSIVILQSERLMDEL